MHWRSFVIWNALGGISWATLVGVVAYLLGHSAGNAIETFGLYGLAALLLAVISTLIVHRRHRRRGRRSEIGQQIGQQIGQRAGEAADPAARRPLDGQDPSEE
jgi:membrane protein implicated in regulation of membrane protease activity